MFAISKLANFAKNIVQFHAVLPTFLLLCQRYRRKCPSWSMKAFPSYTNGVFKVLRLQATDH